MRRPAQKRTVSVDSPTSPAEVEETREVKPKAEGAPPRMEFQSPLVGAPKPEPAVEVPSIPTETPPLPPTNLGPGVDDLSSTAQKEAEEVVTVQSQQGAGDPLGFDNSQASPVSESQGSISPTVETTSKPPSSEGKGSGKT